MSLEIPLPNAVADFSFQVELDSVNYGFRFRLNGRDSCWYMDLSDAQDNILLGGIKLVLNTDLLQRQTSPLLPVGKLVALSSIAADTTEPGPMDLGTRVRLYYTTDV